MLRELRVHQPLTLRQVSNASGFAFEGQTHSIAISDESENESEIESVVDVVDDTQHLYISESEISEDGTQTSLVVSYDALQEETTGLGLRIHFDSDVLHTVIFQTY